MEINDILKLSRVRCNISVSSKKRALEVLSELFTSNSNELSQDDVFDSLFNRERLGTTGVGHGVAIPHARVPGIETPVAAAIKLVDGIEFDTPDNEPVDILFGLLVPQESTDEHLQILAYLAQMFADSKTRNHLRLSDDTRSFFDILTKPPSSHAA